MADYILKTIPELDPATSIEDTDSLVVEKSTGTKKVPFANLKSSIPNYGYLYNVFTSLALSGNTLTINHAKDTRKIRLTVFNPAGISTPLPWYIIDSNNVAINFGGTIEAGDWYYLLEFWTGNSGGEYPDPIYEPAITKSTPTLDQTTKSSQITISQFLSRQYGDIVVCNLRVEALSTYVVNSSVVCGIISVNPGQNIWRFAGSMESTTNYESAYGFVQNNGEIRVRMGKSLQTYNFNFSFSIV